MKELKHASDVLDGLMSGTITKVVFTHMSGSEITYETHPEG